MILNQNNGNIFAEIENALSLKLETNINIKSSSAIGGGCISHASKIETNAGLFFLKWNKSVSSEIFIREAEGLEALRKASNSELIVPEVIAVNSFDSSIGFIVLQFLEHRSKGLDNDEKLGRGLAFIHKTTNQNYGFDSDNFCGLTRQNNSWIPVWKQFYIENRIDVLLHLIEKKWRFSADEFRVLKDFCDKIPDLLPADSVPSLIHGDLWSGNYMLTKNGPALIDPAVSFADREMEFGMITLFGGFTQRFFDAYNEVWPLPAGWQERNQLYQFYHILNHCLLFGGSYFSQAMRIAKNF